MFFILFLLPHQSAHASGGDVNPALRNVSETVQQHSHRPIKPTAAQKTSSRAGSFLSRIYITPGGSKTSSRAGTFPSRIYITPGGMANKKESQAWKSPAVVDRTL